MTVRWVGPGVAAVDNSLDAQLARLPAPVLGKTVNVGPGEGRRLRQAAGHGAARAAQAKGRGFVRLTQARQIPVGSLLDTRKGTVGS